MPKNTDNVMGVKDVFELVFMGLSKPHVREAKQKIQELSARIDRVLTKQNVSWAFERNPKGEKQNPPPIVIKRWTKANREEYLNFNKWRIDKRAGVRTIFGAWTEDLKKAKQLVLKAQSMSTFEQKSDKK